LSQPERRFFLRWALAAGKAPRELAQWVTSEDVTEMIAFSRLEPFGALHDEQMHGAICALTANMNRKRGSDPMSSGNFFAALGREMKIGQPVFVEDKKAMSTLLMEKVFRFKKKPRG
jgi:hypothetical protein